MALKSKISQKTQRVLSKYYEAGQSFSETSTSFSSISSSIASSQESLISSTEISRDQLQNEADLTLTPCLISVENKGEKNDNNENTQNDSSSSLSSDEVNFTFK